ncbi:DNA repair protein RecN [Salinispira pacifica]
MIEELSIQNYALIERLSLLFGPGLNVLSGETGAGKSILAGALGLLHGVKGDGGTIRTGSEEAMVAAVFQVSGNPDALSWLDEHGIEPEEGRIIIRRTLKQSGRGSIYIQSVPTTRSDLEGLSALLFDMHGQHEHQSLFAEDNHRRILDRFGGLEEETAALYRDFVSLSGLKKRLDRIVTSERDRLREADILQYAIREIDEARLSEGEEEELSKERSVLSQHEKLFGLLDEAYEVTSENRGGALAQIRRARQAMDGAVSIDTGLSPLAKRLEDLFFELEDVSEEVHSYRAAVNFSADRLEQVEDRLMAIHRLEKKYGSTIKEILDYRSEASEQLDGLENWEQDKERLQAEIQALEKSVLASAQRLSARRKETAKQLQREIETNLQGLGMQKTRFEIAVTQRLSEKGSPACGPHGIDQVTFRISPNPGEPLKPLRDIASGGEISRVMLAIKTVLAQTDQISTLVFDEIDAGIGGEVAVAVGLHLRQLARHKQVLCITHLASIAARADNHLKVEKRGKNGRTVTEVSEVSGDSRVEEIARMLSGDKTGQASLTHAEELLRKSGEV